MSNFEKIRQSNSYCNINGRKSFRRHCNREKLKAVAINPWWKTLTIENTQQLHDEGFQIYTYTVNEPKDIKSVTELGVDGIFVISPKDYIDV
ncbi:glycerophosphodiester phosphodiesterase [Flavobacterium piscinae]|uniref:glycerophosphodiester phosphodiesterase n=1 Tax=Flavobacterium piscinae TaxID=2506424 RepID=UPI002AAC4C6D|nr:glycerophosphodiester phosphodiesterase family protein [Flavobacterium piscinae]